MFGHRFQLRGRGIRASHKIFKFFICKSEFELLNIESVKSMPEYFLRLFVGCTLYAPWGKPV